MIALPPCIRGQLLLASLVLASCAQEESAAPEAQSGSPPPAPVAEETDAQFVKHEGLVLGETWDGPEKKLYSQGNEELIVRDFFQDRVGGVFLDVGAADPVLTSTTYYLEKHLGWSGVAIDALPEYAVSFEKKRPKTRFVSYIVTDHSGTKEKFYRTVGAPGLSSTVADREFKGRKLWSQMIEVPTTTLDTLLAELGVGRIDFLSMDIEGGEPKALSGFDIERFRPQLVCIEKGEVEFLKEYFADHGYERIDKYLRYDFVNWYYTPAKDDRGEGGSQ